MDPKEELAQPVGNAKIRGEFDTDAATVWVQTQTTRFCFRAPGQITMAI